MENYIMENELFIFKRNAIVGAITDPLCEEYKTYWKACGNDKERLARLVMRQAAIPYFAEHCYRGKGLSKEFILREFGDYINGHTLKDCDNVEGYQYGLYVDLEWSEQDELNLGSVDVSHFMWCSGLDIAIPKTKCPTIYVSNKSSLTINCEGFNSLRVYVFDESTITLVGGDKDTKATVYCYGENAFAEEDTNYFFGTLNVFHKELRL